MAELRRRLWHNIIVVDSYFALDRGTEALITFNSSSRPLPTNVNDQDFDEQSVSAQITPRRGEATDMTFALVVEELSAYVHRLNFLEDKPGGNTWQQRLHLAQSKRNDMEAKYFVFCDSSQDFHRLILKVGRACLTGVILRAVRPVQRDPANVLPPISSPWVFELAVDALRKCIAIWDDRPLAQWKQLIWVQWHPLAVVLAGLCSIQKTEIVDEAWQLVEKMIMECTQHIADTKNGTLWQPIQKLYKKALAFKESNEASSTQPRHGRYGDQKVHKNELTAIATTTAQLPENSSDAMNTNPDLSTSQAYSNDFSAVLETNDWVDWDAIVADMEDVGADTALWS